jgi:transcription factor SFP1
MEANFMKDFSCCGLVLDSLHELLQHYEERHAQASNMRTSQSTQGGLPGSSNGNGASGPTSAVQGQPDSTTHTHNGFRTASAPTTSNAFRSQRLGSDGFSRTNLSTVQDMDSLEDMEMDDADPLPVIEEQPSQMSTPQPYQAPNGLPQLNVNVANTMQNLSGLRTSTPTTPAAGHQGFGLQHNPTVSSVNTPTLGTQSMQQNRSPDSSHPVTPAELNMDFNDFSGLAMPMGSGMMQPSDNWNLGFQNGISNFDGTIDQPAKRLYSKQGGLSQQQLQMAFKNYNLGTDNGEFAKRMREQQLLAGSSNIPPMQFQEEVKPFKCPVIGCEKAYKNQNGLKYHKQVSSCRSIRIRYRLTQHSTVTKISSSRKTQTALSRSSTR